MRDIKKIVREAAEELLEKSGIQAGEIFVLGASTSEVKGLVIGKASSTEVGEAIVETLLEVLRPKGIYLAVQGCEHINRALVIEREALEKYNLEEVTVIPALHAGGACSMAAYKMAEDPAMVEHIVAKAGMDIGDTSIGMHIKFVQVPVRLAHKKVGEANLTALRYRPKLVGGNRAVYPELGGK